MTIYDVLRKLVDGSVWTENERREAFALLIELERHAILGTTASRIHTERKSR